MKSRRGWVSEREGTIVPSPGATWHHDHRRKGFSLSPREGGAGREPERGADLIRKPMLRRGAHAPRVPSSAPSRKTTNAPKGSEDPANRGTQKGWTRGA